MLEKNFLPVDKLSFYWYFPVVLGCLFVFVIYLRKRLGERYTVAALFIVLLGIANSMYFFGRSHENNVLNLTGILVLTLFTLFDVLIFHAPEDAKLADIPAEADKKVVAIAGKKGVKTPVKSVATVKRSLVSARRVYVALPVLFVFLLGYYYSERIYHKVEAQYNNLLESNLASPMVSGTMDTAAVRYLTHGSKEVYFMDAEFDFYYYYYGKYVPQGYYTPFCAFVYKKDIVDFIQGMLDKGYYVVYNAKEANYITEYFSFLRYNQMSQKNDIVALKEDNVPLLLPQDNNSLLHIGIRDSLASPGLDRNMPSIKGDFTIEVVLKPVGGQVTNAAILNNLSQFESVGLRGFAFQQNGVTPNQYIIAFTNGTPNVPNVVFNLDNNVWHYVVATINKDNLKVYDNGKLVTTGNSGGAILVDSELPLTIGNRQNRDCHFRGYIREVNITNGNLSESEITSRGQKIDASLNNAIQNLPK